MVVAINRLLLVCYILHNRLIVHLKNNGDCYVSPASNIKQWIKKERFV